jgi:hypothetical protein
MDAALKGISWDRKYPTALKSLQARKIVRLKALPCVA